MDTAVTSFTPARELAVPSGARGSKEACRRAEMVPFAAAMHLDSSVAQPFLESAADGVARRGQVYVHSNGLVLDRFGKVRQGRCDGAVGAEIGEQRKGANNTMARRMCVVCGLWCMCVCASQEMGKVGGRRAEVRKR